MSLDRALQLNTTALAVTGAVFLGLGHENIVMPLVLAVGAALALAVTDIRRWLLLHRWLANLIALAAVAWSLRRFLSLDSEQQLLAIANMLVCLQLVLLFQDKSPRVYWQLLVLSLLQVVVAAALCLGLQFGLVLAPYVLLALTQLVLLCLQRDLRGQDARDLRSQEARQLSPAGKANWRMLLAPPAVGPLGVPAADLRRSFPARTIARHVALLAVATLLFTAVFFYATPRLNENPWQGMRRGAMSGLASEVRLKQSGRIHLSNEVVMRALLTRFHDRSVVPLVGEPYFTGATLNDYLADSGASRWVAGPRRVRSGTGQPTSGAGPPSLALADLVRQEIVLEVGSTPLYPAILPVQRLGETPREMRNLRTKLDRTQEGEPHGREFRYAWATPAIKSGRQARATPHPNPLATLSDEELSALVQFDSARFPRLAEIAAAAVREQGAQEGTQLDKALALERHFRATQLYNYSLNLDMERKHELDPLEDFVAHHRTGYCEYFAGALVLMLRSQGIPARMVIGYKGGELNSLGHYYVVKQRHAHAWVEAWIPKGDVAAWEIAGPASGGVWYRLDPTPGVRETFTSATEDTLARRLAHTFDYADLLWRDYVLSLNKSRQEDTIYDPLTARATALPAWLEARTVHRWLRRWSARLGVDLVPPPGRGGPRAFEGSLALVVAGGLLAVVGLVQAALFARRRWARWWAARSRGPRAVAHPPAFYRRLEQLLAQLPLRRRAGQTPRELALAAQQRLAGAGTPSPVAQIPAEIVAEYYRVRFGAARLDKSQTAAIEHALHTLAPAVSQANPR